MVTNDDIRTQMSSWQSVYTLLLRVSFLVSITADIVCAKTILVTIYLSTITTKLGFMCKLTTEFA